jgi:hypothetical protein
MSEQTRSHLQQSAVGMGLALCITAAHAVALDDVNIELTPIAPDTTDHVHVSVSGTLPDPCHEVTTRVETDGFSIQAVLTVVNAHPGDFCAAVTVPFTVDLPIGTLDAGVYSVRVEQAFADSFQTEILLQTALMVADCDREAREVEQLELDKTYDDEALSTQVHFSWLDSALSTDYLVLEAAVPDEAFGAGFTTNANGLVGVTASMPEVNKFYLVVGRNDECGLGFY